MKRNQLIVYTKFCLNCIMPDFWRMFQKEAVRQGYSLETIRTTYRPFAHKKASSIWKSDDYFAFVVFPDGGVFKLEGAMDMWQEKAKNKLVKSGKKKSTRRRKKDVQGLSETPRTIRVDGAEDTGTDIEVKVEGDN